MLTCPSSNFVPTKQRKSKRTRSEQSPIKDDWISATSLYNYMMKDPLLDWFKYHSETLSRNKKSYRELINNCLVENKSPVIFTPYIMEHGKVFEDIVLQILHKKFGSERIAEIHGELGPRDPARYKATLEAMKEGIPIIHSGIVMNSKTKTFGIPDLLVRSDWLNLLTQSNPISKSASQKRASKLKGKYHYRVVDIKFTTLPLRSDGLHLLNSGSFPAYKAQLYIYNMALGQMQGYTPGQAYILGRRWKYTSRGETYIGDNCLDRLGIINYNVQDNDYPALTRAGLKWLREVRSEDAADWNILDYPLDRWELYPNMSNNHDYPWHGVKEKLAHQTKELTSLWMVGPKNRNLALKEGISSWTDPNCTSEILGITGVKTSKILNSIININHQSICKIAPKIIKTDVGGWKQPDLIEFFVDFETTNGTMGDICDSGIANTDNLIFMIGVGYTDPYDDIWIYKDFTVNSLTLEEEEKVCREFSKYIRKTSREYGLKNPRCIHWSRAEDLLWNDAVDRHCYTSAKWKSWKWRWFDLMTVFKEEPVVLHGCMSFSLKDVARTMKEHGMISTIWDENSSCLDGQSAMIAAQIIYKRNNKRMREDASMQQIIEYNEVDVKVLSEIITYLRSYHSEEGLVEEEIKDSISSFIDKEEEEEDSDEEIQPTKRARK